eukprot:COSAG02_NODE_92_length_37588_cov_135.916242_13_plen_101_part_00
MHRYGSSKRHKRPLRQLLRLSSIFCVRDPFYINWVERVRSFHNHTARPFCHTKPSVYHVQRFIHNPKGSSSGNSTSHSGHSTSCGERLWEQHRYRQHSDQ